MQPAELENYLHTHIPISKALGVSVTAISDETVVLKAPLQPNINHRDTVFGGSASSLAILSAWSLLHTRLYSAGIESRLVIQRNTMEYLQPILGDFTASAVIADARAWERFTRVLMRKSKARMTVVSTVESGSQLVGTFSGEFVALGSKL